MNRGSRMSDLFLYQRLNALSEFELGDLLDREIPDSITQNLNPAFEIRPYQEEAFARFIHCFHKGFQGKCFPVHLLFNMATGSGKTLVMAGLILYLYERGYRNFLFFVNSTNIIKKTQTQENFLNLEASKYLFNREIHIKGRRVELRQVESFHGVSDGDINICFTTIQQLHADMTTGKEKENALTNVSFEHQKIVLLSDEAHHMNVGTRSKSQQELFESWENTVERIFKSNKGNLLLEFTATHDYENSDIIEKYRNKVIYRYDLIDFRNHGFSKDIGIVRSDFDQQDRILQAIILNYYKQRVASEYGIQLKPVILFKEQKRIADSEKNKANFHKLIDELTGSQIEDIRASKVEIVQKAFRFFDKNDISSERLAQHLKSAFQERYCLSVNNDKEKETNQILVNTLEDRDNPIRAIFAVQKLNEGWDVLNLFDIVRCYKGRDARFGKAGKTTISEAQLIGRGARYFPFTVPENDDGLDLPGNNDKFQRKFDENLDHELRVLEELHYHSLNEPRYISEIHAALVKEGIVDEHVVTRELKLKDAFKETDLYNYGSVWLNKREPRDYQDVTSFTDLADLTVKQKNHEHTVHSGAGDVMTVTEDREIRDTRSTDSMDIHMVDIEPNIVQSAIARNPFFTFSSLKQYFPNLTSMDDFKISENYLGGLAITFKGNLSQLEDNPVEKLKACCDLLDKIESELRVQITDYKGTTTFHRERISTIFTDKTLKFSVDNPRVSNESQTFDERIVKENKWLAYNGLFGTSEERALVELLDRWVRQLGNTYDYIYLLRNERHFALYKFSDGRAFEPDFVLYLDETNGEALTYQLFVEPKGEHLEDKERWKEDFLREIDTDQSLLIVENSKYRVRGVPTFFNSNRENEFIVKLNETLGISHPPQGQETQTALDMDN